MLPLFLLFVCFLNCRYYFLLQKKIHLSGISLNGLDDSEIQKHSFEIVGKMLRTYCIILNQLSEIAICVVVY